MASRTRLLDQGWTDAIRKRFPDERVYTFWDYMRNRWPRDAGLRLDLLLLSKKVARRLADAGVDRHVRGEEGASDHAPVWVCLKDRGLSSQPEYEPRHQVSLPPHGEVHPPFVVVEVEAQAAAEIRRGRAVGHERPVLRPGKRLCRAASAPGLQPATPSGGKCRKLDAFHQSVTSGSKPKTTLADSLADLELFAEVGALFLR